MIMNLHGFNFDVESYINKVVLLIWECEIHLHTCVKIVLHFVKYICIISFVVLVQERGL